MIKYKNFKILDLLSWINILLIPLLITGPLLPEIALNVGIIIFIYHLYTVKKLSYFKSYFTYFFAIFFLYIVVNSLLNFNFFSIKSSFLYFRFYILAMMVAYCIENSSFFLKNFIKINIILVIALVFDGLIQYLTEYNIFGWKKIVDNRISGFFGDEMVFGSYLIRILPILLASYIFVSIDKFKKLNFFLIILIFFIGISISGERTAFFLFLLFVILIIPVVISFYNKIKHLILLGIISTILIFFSGGFERNLKSIINSMLISDGNKIIDVRLFSYVHESHYKTAYKIYNDNKFLGVGIKRFRVECKNPNYYINRHSCSTHPHNYYMQFLSELGLFGTIFLIIFLFYSIYNLYFVLKKNIKKKYFKEFYILNSGILALLFPLAPSGNFFNNWLSFFFFFIVGFLFFFSKKIKA